MSRGHPWRKAGTSHYPVQSVSQKRSRWIALFEHEKASIHTTPSSKSTGWTRVFELKPSTEYVSRFGELLRERATIVKCSTSPRSAFLSNIGVKAQSEATHGPSRSLKLVATRYYQCSAISDLCGTSESRRRVSISAFNPQP